MSLRRSTLVLVVFFFAPISVLADSVAVPRSYSVPSANGKFIFVMIAPIDSELKSLSWPEAHNQEKIIRAKYSFSGMYLNDGSTNPLWTVDWYAFSVLVPNDGVHLVRLGPWAQSLSDESFTFYENGKEIRSYKIGDLVDTRFFLPQSVSHFEWEENITIDDQNRTLSVGTLSKEQYHFDFTTGKLVTARRPLRAILVTIGVVFAFLVLCVLRRRRVSANRALEH